MTSKCLERKHNLSLMSNKLMKLVDLGEPTSFLDHVYVGCIQRECKPKHVSLRNTENVRITNFCGEQQFSGCEEPHAKTVMWSCDVEGHAKKCVEQYCEVANMNTEQLCKGSTPCLDDHNFNKEELETVGELSKVCS